MRVANKKVLVIGADGFIGSHHVEMLVKRGAKVNALSFYNLFNNWGWLEDVDCIDEIKVITGEVCVAHLCRSIVWNKDNFFIWLHQMPFQPVTSKCFDF